MLTKVNPIDFGGQMSKVKVTMVNIDKSGVREDATLCIVIFNFTSISIRPLLRINVMLDLSCICFTKL